MLHNFLHKMSNINDMINYSYQSKKREREHKTIINRKLRERVGSYDSQSNYRSKKATRWKRNIERHLCRTKKQASEGQSHASTEFQVDDKIRMTGIQCRRKTAFPIEDEFLIARARVGPNTLSRRQSITVTEIKLA